MNERQAHVQWLEQRRTVRVGKQFARAISFYYHNLEVPVPCPIPPVGGVILVSNHVSSVDPLYLQAACPRLITWMMAKEYAGTFGTKWFFDAIEVILVERSGRDLAATRLALRALKDGKMLGMFPEGRIAKTKDLLEFQTGVALLAIKSGVPVYPAFLDGTQRCKGMAEACLVPNRSTLRFGPAVEFDRSADGREGLDEATKRIRDAVAALGTNGGQPAPAIAAF